MLSRGFDTRLQIPGADRTRIAIHRHDVMQIPLPAAFSTELVKRPVDRDTEIRRPVFIVGATMTKMIHGKISGNTIELDKALDIPEGQEVEVHVKVVSNVSPKTGEGFLRTEGALADDLEWDSIMEEVYTARRSSVIGGH